jgi:hypothetical protein
MSVLHLVRKSNQDTVELLECMLALARCGEIEDVEAIYTRLGTEQRAFTGRYRHMPGEALSAAFRTSIVLTQQERAVRGDP